MIRLYDLERMLEHYPQVFTVNSTEKPAVLRTAAGR
jgi:hypothetical protein